MWISSSLFLHLLLTLRNVEYFTYFGSIITGDARGARVIKSKVAMVKTPSSKKKAFFVRKMDSYLKKKLVKCYIWSMDF